MAKDKGKKGKGFGKRFNKNQNRLGVFQPLPKGDYSVVVKKAEINPTKAKDGKVLTLTYEVLKGSEKGKTFKQWLTFDHPNQTTVDIALQHLASLCDAVGIAFEDLENPEELINKKLIISLAVDPGKDGYGPSNKAIAYEEIGKEKTKGKDKKEKKKNKKKKDKKKNKVPF